jgi:hypothetical protein
VVDRLSKPSFDNMPFCGNSISLIMNQHRPKPERQLRILCHSVDNSCPYACSLVPGLSGELSGSVEQVQARVLPTPGLCRS